MEQDARHMLDLARAEINRLQPDKAIQYVRELGIEPDSVSRTLWIESQLVLAEAYLAKGDVAAESFFLDGSVATRFGVSLEAAARRLSDLGLWRWPIGMWNCSTDPRQLWFVGSRPWQTDRPCFAAFELALESQTPICTNEYFSKGAHNEPVALKAFHIGKNFVVAMAATSR